MLRSDCVLDSEGFIESAERDLLVGGKSEFFFPLRRKVGVLDFYERLEKELREQDLFLISEYRVVKEGWAKISRPSVLKVDKIALIRHRPHLVVLEQAISGWRRDFSEIGADQFVELAYKDAIANPALTRACFEVFSYLIQHREEIRGLLPRQVQHTNSTKLIGRESLLLRLFSIWRGETATWNEFFRYFELADRPVEFRFFAPRCLCQNSLLSRFHGVIANDWYEDYDFTGLAGTLIVENLETFQAEAAQSLNRLILWGGGWRATLLRKLQSRLPRPILYWGDIDKEGYEIYGYLRSFIPDLRASLMDKKTVDKHLRLSLTKERFFGPFRDVADLQTEYQDVCQRGLCIEQEKIHDRPY